LTGIKQMLKQKKQKIADISRMILFLRLVGKVKKDKVENPNFLIFIHIPLLLSLFIPVIVILELTFF
jgi:hypothetical protein